MTTIQATFGRIVLGGSATSLVKGNGTLLTGAGFVKGDATLDTTAYTRIVSVPAFAPIFFGTSSPNFTAKSRTLSQHLFAYISKSNNDRY